MADPNTAPLTTAGLDPTVQLMQVIQQIQALQQQPLVHDDPLSQMGAIFSGFASGVRGERNPAITQALAQRESAQRGLSIQAGLAGNLATIAHQQRQEKRLEEDSKLRQQTHLAGIVNQAIDDGLKTGDANSVAFGLYKRAQLTGQPMTLSDARVIAEDAVNRDLLNKRGKELATYALIGSPLPGTPQGIVKMAAEQPAVLRQLYGIADPEAEKAKIEKDKADAAKSNWETGLKQREFDLRRLPARTPSQQMELDAIDAMKGSPDRDNVRTLTRYYMQKDPSLPFDMAVQRALRLIRDASQQPDKPEKLSDMKTIAASILAKNPGIDEGEALLRAYQAAGMARKTAQENEDGAERVKDILNNVEFYAGKVQSEGLLRRAASMPGNTLSYLTGNDPNIKGLHRQLGYLASIMRELGERGAISDKDNLRGELLLGDLSIYADAQSGKDAIRDLRKIISNGQERMRQRREGAVRITPADDPDDIRRFMR